MNGRVRADDMYFTRLQQQHTAAKNMKRHLLKSGKKRDPHRHSDLILRFWIGFLEGKIKTWSRFKSKNCKIISASLLIVMCPKYSKHWPYTVAHTIDCVCSNFFLNQGLFLLLFKGQEVTQLFMFFQIGKGENKNIFLMEKFCWINKYFFFGLHPLPKAS